MSKSLACLFLSSSLLMACGGGGGGDDQPDANDTPAPTLEVTVPGGANCGEVVTVGVTVGNFVLEEPTGQPDQDGHGHYHVYFDQATGGDYLVTDFATSTDVPLPFAAATAGMHELRIELASNNHLGTGVEAIAPIMITTNACVAATVNPTTVPPGGGVTVDVEVGNFILEEPVGQPNQVGHGHYHIYLDGAVGTNYLESGAADPVDIVIPAATAVGAHTLRVSIGDNGHVPLSPAVETILDITVQ